MAVSTKEKTFGVVGSEGQEALLPVSAGVSVKFGDGLVISQTAALGKGVKTTQGNEASTWVGVALATVDNTTGNETSASVLVAQGPYLSLPYSSNVTTAIIGSTVYAGTGTLGGNEVIASGSGQGTQVPVGVLKGFDPSDPTKCIVFIGGKAS